MNQIHEQKRGRGNKSNTNTNTNTTTPKKQTPSISWKEVDFEKEDICNGTREVSEGMKGDIVGYIQRALNVNLGTNLSEDDHFGEETRKAVTNFQYKNKKEYNLTINGKVDKATYSALMKDTSFGCKTEEKKNTTNMEKKSTEKVDTIKKNIPKIVQYKMYGEQKETKVNSNISEQNTTEVKKKTPRIVDAKESFLFNTMNTKDKQGLSCIDKVAKTYNLKKHPTISQVVRIESEDPSKGTDPAFVYLGMNPKTKNEEEFYIASDGTKLFGVWADGLTSSIDCVGEVDYMSDDNLSEKQKMFINYYVTDASGYKKTIEPGKEEYYDKFDIVNTFKGASDYFAPNTYFVYKRKGYKVEERGEDFYNQIEKVLNEVGWTYKKPDIDSYAYSTKTDIRKQFPQYTEMFPNGLVIYFTGDTRSAKQQKLVSTLMTDIKGSAGSPDGKTCRDAINILYDAKQGWDKKIIYFSGDTELETVRNYVKQCQVKFEKNFFRFLGGGAKEKYEELKSKKHGPNGVMKFNLSENLNSLIKKKLLTIKEQKDNNKIIKKIVENRLGMIVESIKKNKNIDKLSLNFMLELNQLNEQGLVNEDFGENLKNIFGSDLSSMPKTFFENIFDKILTNINMNDSSLKKSLVLMSEKNPSDIVKAFKDCSSMSDLIAKSIVEILHDDISSDDNSTGTSLSSIKTLLGQEIKKDEFIQKVKNNIDDLVCQEFTKLKSNAENLISKIKGNSNDDLSGNL
jgi:peptidoglycan hydrolase-like protein with peptidoglycan-binding domain